MPFPLTGDIQLVTAVQLSSSSTRSAIRAAHHPLSSTSTSASSSREGHASQLVQWHGAGLHLR